MSDPLAKFRVNDAAKPSNTSISESLASGLPAYQAFEAKDRTKRLEIRLAKGKFNIPSYAYLLTIIPDGFKGTEVDLIFSFMVVRIKGRNLQPVTLALQKGDCSFIQDFDSAQFSPPESTEPFIESINIVMKGEQGSN